MHLLLLIGLMKIEELASQPFKDLSKIKCFICHKNDYQASRCLEKKKGERKKPEN